MSRFATIEISDPRYERDGLRQITVKSPALNGRGDICVFVPVGDETSQNLPIVLLLHGVYGSCWSWAYSNGAHLTTQHLISTGKIAPLILAMPSDGLWGDGSAYLPHHSANYESWIVDDVIDCIHTIIPQASTNSPLFINGLSMGGFGALHLGAKYADRFQGISAHSAITHFDQMQQFSKQGMATYQLRNSEESHILHWMRQNKPHLPLIRFDCGTDDNLLAPNQALHAELTALEIPHIYQQFSGGHTHEYWHEHLQDALCFFDEILSDSP